MRPILSSANSLLIIHSSVVSSNVAVAPLGEFVTFPSARADPLADFEAHVSYWLAGDGVVPVVGGTVLSVGCAVLSESGALLVESLEQVDRGVLADGG